MRKPHANDGGIDDIRALAASERCNGLQESDPGRSSSCLHTYPLSTGYAPRQICGDTDHRTRVMRITIPD